MEIRYTADPVRFDRMSTEEIRESFLVDTLFREDRISMVYCNADRAIVGSAVPATRTLSLESAPELRAETFCARRELGVLNIGGPGTVTVDGVKYPTAGRDALYVGRGSRAISFASGSTETPAKYYLLSFPAHAAHPTVHIRQSEAERLPFADGSFDAVVANFLINHLAEPDSAVAEVCRVLRSGGRAAFTPGRVTTPI